MNHSDPFQNLFPFMLENIARETGDLVGESIGLEQENIFHGSLQKIFSPPSNKFVLTGLYPKETSPDPAYLLMELDMAVDLGAKLIMLPENESAVFRKQGKLDGEILDAFSEIVNIIAGIINATCEEHMGRNKLYFTKGEPEVLTPKKSELPFSTAPHSLMSAFFVPTNGISGTFQLLFPHTLLTDQPDAAQTKAQKDTFFEELPVEATVSEQTAEMSQNSDLQAETMVDQPLSSHPDPSLPDDSTETALPEKRLDPKNVALFLIESLDSAREELEALLGGSLEFSDQQTKRCTKTDMLVKTRGKQVLTKIEVSGDKEGESYMLLPLKDAVFAGATLLLMPPEAITQSIKQGKFEEDVADAFGEVANIMVGCYSNRFRTDFPIKLALKKNTVELLVPSQVDPGSRQPFQEDDYYAVSTRIKMGETQLGPLELFFPTYLLGLEPDNTAGTPVEKTVSPEAPPETQQYKTASISTPYPESLEESQQKVSGQNNDTGFPVPEQQSHTPPAMVVIGRNAPQLGVLREILDEEHVELKTVPPEKDFRPYLSHEKLCCVFLFLDNINEQGFALIIKVRAMMPANCPLVVSGAEWTRSSVLKAVKYGATDILIDNAGKNSIRKKCYKHLYSNQGLN